MKIVLSYYEMTTEVKTGWLRFSVIWDGCGIRKMALERFI